MSLKLMYITNDPAVARIAEAAGVDRIFVDMEYIGKADRQGGMDTVQSHHTVEDVKRIKDSLTTAKLVVRVNPIHEAGEYRGYPHSSSKEEIDAVIEAGADIVMLPFFKSKEEVEAFIKLVNHRAETMLLLETDAAVQNLDDILTVDGIDQIHIGINDLSLDQGKCFMFQQLADGTCDAICRKIRERGIPYGIGGIASPGKGMLPAGYIIRDHYRLGSTCAILSRAFCNTSVITDQAEIRSIFNEGLKEIRAVEASASLYTEEKYAENHKELQVKVQQVADIIMAKRNSQ